MKSTKTKKTIIQPKIPAFNRKIRRAAAGEHLNKEFKELGLQKGLWLLFINVLKLKYEGYGELESS